MTPTTTPASEGLNLMHAQAPAMLEELLVAYGGWNAQLAMEPVSISANLAHGLIALLTSEICRRAPIPTASPLGTPLLADGMEAIVPQPGIHEPGLGWRISKEARDKIERLVSDNVHNAAALHGIILATLPASPIPTSEPSDPGIRPKQGGGLADETPPLDQPVKAALRAWLDMQSMENAGTLYNRALTYFGLERTPTHEVDDTP